MAKNDFAGDLKPKNKPTESKGYTYRKRGKNGRKKDVVTYSLEPELVDKVERIAYATRKTMSEVIETILKEKLDGRDFEPIPQDKPIEL